MLNVFVCICVCGCAFVLEVRAMTESSRYNCALYIHAWEGKRERGLHVYIKCCPHLAGMGITLDTGHEDEASSTV